MNTVPSHREKSPLASKKFTAWCISELTWKAILILALVQWKGDLTQVSTGAWWLLLAIVITAGFTEIGFILGQAALDKYVRVAEIAAEQISDKFRKANPDAETTDPKVSQ